MNPPSELPDVLAAASPGQHIARLYSVRQFLDRAVAQFLGEGLRRGEAAFVVARPRHWQAVARRLAEQRFDLVPSTTTALLERARHHYGEPGHGRR